MLAPTVQVPFLDLRAPHQELRDELQEAFLRVIDSGWYILGREVPRFEQEFAAYCGTTHCVGVGNGLEALHLILRGYDIGEGDEVIVPPPTSCGAAEQRVAEPGEGVRCVDWFLCFKRLT